MSRVLFTLRQVRPAIDLSCVLFALGGMAGGLVLALAIVAAIDKPGQLLTEARARIASLEKEKATLETSLGETDAARRAAEASLSDAWVKSEQPDQLRSEPDWHKVKRRSLREFWFLGRVWRYEHDTHHDTWLCEAFGCGDPDVRVSLLYDNEDVLVFVYRQQRFTDDGAWLDHGPWLIVGAPWSQAPLSTFWSYMGKDLGGMQYAGDGSINNEEMRFLDGTYRSVFYGDSPHPVEEIWYAKRDRDPAYKADILANGARSGVIGHRPKIALPAERSP